MTGAITFEFVIFIIVVGSALGGAWWFLYSAILTAKREAQRDIQQIRKDHADYKLLVAERYASQEHLKEVETRLVSAIDKLATQLDTMPDRLSRIIQQAIKDSH